MPRVGALFLGLTAAVGAGAAETRPGPTSVALVVFDLRQAPADEPTRGPEGFAFAQKTVIAELLAPIEQGIDPAVPISKRVAAIREVGVKVREHARESALRAVSEDGEIVRVAVLFDATLTTEENHWEVRGRRPELIYDEQSRESRLQADLRALLQLGASLAGGGRTTRGGTTAPIAWLIVQEYRLRAERATLSVTASLTEQAVTLAAGDGDASSPTTVADRDSHEEVGAASQQSLKVALVTGPREHWFLSADVPLTGASQLKRNAQTGLLELASEPSAFYVGVNFVLGDLLAARQSLADVIAVKLMIKASRQPLDSVGFGLALRGRHLRKYGLDFDLFSPFVGYTFTHEDKALSTGAVVTDGERNRELRFGVSLNLDKALGWVKGK